MVKLGKLVKIPLREAWKNEAYDFTNWLAAEENLNLLSEEIGIEIKLIETEANVGKYSVDLLAEEENTGRKIIIENQLEQTNHDHLGKIITYASGYDAEIIVWIVANIREEHEHAIDWLNEHSDSNINFFVLRLELWQIGESPYAPKFNIISKPNDWAKIVKQSTSKDSLTQAKIFQLDFWNEFKEYAISQETKLKLRAPSPQHWYSFSIGSSLANISLTVNTRENLIACELYILDSKQLYNSLVEYRESIESELNEKLEWMGLEDKKASRIKLSREADLESASNLEEYFAWLLDKAEEFQKIFRKYINKISKEKK